ncbi:hypothetical protein DPMN_147706 [Dreissena polymorpha]|uniref:Uncharacterized protein n=1 Tax=Dreissena polymorpha TaxID=45954 RepID=A0A9D4FCM0_DREPO|nr:hypothetical protein DPMN_147706 [Dreissena polymorpha]
MNLTYVFYTICIVSIIRCQFVSGKECLLIHALFDGHNVTLTFTTRQNQTYGNPEVKPNNAFHCEWIYDRSNNAYTCVSFNYSQTHKGYVQVAYGPCTSQWVWLDLTASPALGPRQNVDGCEDCLIAAIGEWKDISCSLSTYMHQTWNVTITINNNTSNALKYSTERYRYRVIYNVKDIDHMAIVVCTMASTFITLIDITRLYVKGTQASQLPFSTHVVSNVVNPKTTKSALRISTQIKETSTGTLTSQLPFSTHVVSSDGSPKTTKSAFTISTLITEPSKVSSDGSPKTTKSALTIPTPIKETSTDMLKLRHIFSAVYAPEGGQVVIALSVCQSVSPTVRLSVTLCV